MAIQFLSCKSRVKWRVFTDIAKSLDDDYASVRRESALALGKIVSEEAINGLATAQLSDSYLSVRLEAITALGNIGGEQALLSLRKTLNDPDFFIRSRTISAIGKIKNVQTPDNFLKDIWGATSETTLEPKSISLIEPELANLSLLRNSIYTIAEIGREHAIPCLLEALNNKYTVVRHDAVLELEKIFEYLFPYKNTILKTNAKYGENDDLHTPHSNLEEDWGNLYFAWHLGKLGTKETILDLVHTIDDEDWRVRLFAIRSLGKIGDINIIPSLINCLQDQNAIVRLFTVRSLAIMKDKNVIPSLIALLNDPDRWVRDEVIITLGLFRDKRAVNPLLDLLDKSEESWRRRQIVETLGNIRDIQAIPNLLLELMDSSIHDKASEAIVEIVDASPANQYSQFSKRGEILVRIMEKLGRALPFVVFSLLIIFVLLLVISIPGLPSLLVWLFVLGFCLLLFFTFCFSVISLPILRNKPTIHNFIEKLKTLQSRLDATKSKVIELAESYTSKLYFTGYQKISAHIPPLRIAMLALIVTDHKSELEVFVDRLAFLESRRRSFQDPLLPHATTIFRNKFQKVIILAICTAGLAILPAILGNLFPISKSNLVLVITIIGAIIIVSIIAAWREKEEKKG